MLRFGNEQKQQKQKEEQKELCNQITSFKCKKIHGEIDILNVTALNPSVHDDTWWCFRIPFANRVKRVNYVFIWLVYCLTLWCSYNRSLVCPPKTKLISTIEYQYAVDKSAAIPVKKRSNQSQLVGVASFPGVPANGCQTPLDFHPKSCKSSTRKVKKKHKTQIATSEKAPPCCVTSAASYRPASGSCCLKKKEQELSTWNTFSHSITWTGTVSTRQLWSLRGSGGGGGGGGGFLCEPLFLWWWRSYGRVVVPDAGVSEDHMRRCSWMCLRQTGEVCDISLTPHVSFPRAEGLLQVGFCRQTALACLCDCFLLSSLVFVLFLQRDEIERRSGIWSRNALVL